jgi:hypothetical protein
MATSLRFSLRLCAFLTLAGFLIVTPRAAADDMVPFVIPAKVDGKSLIAMRGEPIAAGGPRVAAGDGHFFVGKTRMKVWGVNFCFGASFPAHADAEQIAARLEAFGVNSVRLHHMDSQPFPAGIWDRQDATKLSAEALDRLDYFIDQLARRGVYCDVNLHVSRTHSKILKLPDADKLPGYDKMVDLFTPQLIDAQKRYARDLLTHVNAYRKTRYADDAAVAFVEINNEDSLFMWGAESELRNLPDYYAGLLRSRFADYLKSRYGTTDKLREAWSKGAEELGDDLLTAGVAMDQAKGWRLEQHEKSRGQAAPQGKAGLRIAIANDDGTGWHLQLVQGGLKLKGGKYYTLSFRAKAAATRTIGYGCGQHHEPWNSLGLGGQVNLGEPWGTYRFGFVASADDDNARVSFALGGAAAAVELDDISLRPGGREGLAKDETVEAGNIALFAAAETDARATDRMMFLATTEKAYFDDMRNFVKKDLGCKAMVTGTIVFGPLGLYAQSDMDYIDGHAYWNHPQFPGRPWDPANWIVTQTAMVDHPEQSPLFELAAERLAGKPYTVSEYNHPAPNDCQAECVPMISAFAASQDWDGVWLFAYSHRTGDVDPQHFESFFDIDANPAKWGFMPAGAIIFRTAAVRPADAQRTFALSDAKDVLADLVRLHQKSGMNMLAAIGADKKDRTKLLRTRLAVKLNGKDDYSVVDGASALVEGLYWPRVHERGWFNCIGSGCRIGIVGPIGGVREHLGEPGESGNLYPGYRPACFASTTVPLDGLPYEKSQKLLVTVCGRCENTGMKFSDDRRTVGRDWGKPPVLIEAVTSTSDRGTQLPSGHWKCQALAPDGTAATDVPVKVDQEKHREYVKFDSKYKTMWYVLTRSE